MNIILLHYPQTFDFKMFGVVLDVVVEEGVHVLHQDLHGGLVDDVGVVGFVHHVLQQQHEQDQHLFESPRLGVQGHTLQELRQPVADANALEVSFFLLVAVYELLKEFERVDLLPYLQADVLSRVDLLQVHENLGVKGPVNLIFLVFFHGLGGVEVVFCRFDILLQSDELVLCGQRRPPSGLALHLRFFDFAGRLSKKQLYLSIMFLLNVSKEGRIAEVGLAAGAFKVPRQRLLSIRNCRLLNKSQLR